MAFSYTSGVNNTGNDAAPTTGVHGVEINNGDLVVCYINSNATTAITASTGGTTFTEAVNEQPTAESSRQALYWKIAGASEPTSYSFVSGLAEWQVIIKVFTSAKDAEVSLSAQTHITSSNAVNMVCGAVNGRTIADNSLSLIAGGKDNRSGSTEDYTDADNSYVSAMGESGTQMAAMAHRIYATGEAVSYNVTIQPVDASDDRSDKTYSAHLTFIESTAGEIQPTSASIGITTHPASIYTSITANTASLEINTIPAAIGTADYPFWGTFFRTPYWGSGTLWWRSQDIDAHIIAKTANVEITAYSATIDTTAGVVNCSTASVEITPFPCEINADIIAANTSAIEITTYAAQIYTSLAPVTANIEISTYSATIDTTIGVITPTTANIQITTNPATIIANTIDGEQILTISTNYQSKTLYNHNGYFTID